MALLPLNCPLGSMLLFLLVNYSCKPWKTIRLQSWRSSAAVFGFLFGFCLFVLFIYLFIFITLWAISRCSGSGGVPLGVCVCFLCAWPYLFRTEEKLFISTWFLFILWFGEEVWFLVNIFSMNIIWNKVDKPLFFPHPSLINTACSSVEFSISVLTSVF